MRKLSVFLSVIISIFIWFSFAAPATLSSSYSIDWDNEDYTASDSHYVSDDTSITEDKWAITRTVIPVVPKTWPSINIIWIILATLVVFGGYIYIKKKADI